MRRLAIIISILGAVAFAALLAWGLTFGSSVVQADDDADATATAEADATATAEADATATAEADEAADDEAADDEAADDEAADDEAADDEAADETPAAADYCTPVIPGTYNGAVTIDGAPAPDGTTITALIGTATWGTATTSNGLYVVDVPATPPAVEPCFQAGTVTFQCGSIVATETAEWSAGLNDLALTCVSAVVPTTPTPTVEPTPMVEPTPTVLPPTGMGGMSGDGGFMWWPLALAAAALTSVAGLLTARSARR